MLSSWSSCCAGISQRWVFAVMTFLALWLGNGLRVALSISITEMTIPIEEKTNQLDDTCSVIGKNISKNRTTIDNSSGDRYNWDEYTQGIILSSYFWGYATTHFPAGFLAERYGGKYFLGLSIFVPAVLTFLTPVAIQYGESRALIILRVVMGLASGAMYPAASTMLSRWTAPFERTKIGGAIYAGSLLGTVSGTTISALIIRYSGYGWPAVFHGFGAVGMAWFLLWIIFCYSSPKQHPFISQAEFKFLKDHSERKKKPPPAPYKHIFTSKQCWAFIIAMFGADITYFTTANDLPKYLSSVVKFSIEDNGYMSSLPYLCGWIFSIFCFWMGDRMIERKWRLVTVRKIFTSISIVGPAVFIVAASYSQCDRVMVVSMFMVGVMLMGGSYSSIYLQAQDLSPCYSGTLMALGNGAAAIGGIFTPLIIGVLTPNQTIGEWRLVFWIVFVMAVMCCLYFLIYASGEIQPWNDPDFLRNEKLKNGMEKTGIVNVAVISDNPNLKN